MTFMSGVFKKIKSAFTKTGTLFSDLRKSKQLYLFLGIFCVLGSWSVIPYLQYLEIPSPSISTLRIFLFVTLQAAILYGLICYLCYKILPKTDLNPFPHRISIIKALLSGLLVGFAMYFLDKVIFFSSNLSQTNIHPPFWVGMLASFYGGFNEEILNRLFLFTLVYFCFRKFFRFANSKRPTFLWITNIIVAMIFGLGHLPVAFKLTTPSFFEVFRILLLNGVGGIVFGWLYWSRGLWTAMIAHFIADIFIHVVL